MTFKTFLIGITAFALTACSDNDDPVQPVVPAPEPDPEPEPTEVTITLENSSLQLAPGESFQLVFSVDPEGSTVKWTSSDQKIAMVDRNGRVMGLSLGTATITARSGDATASCEVTVGMAAAVGDFYYSDGSYNTALLPDKQVIGVIFWLGDPTADDAALRRDHPECTHGLVIAAFPDITPSPWQAANETYAKTAGTWIEQNCPEYQSPTSAWQQDTRRNMILGYNNTKALEAFNADQANSQWPVNAIQKVAEFRNTTPAPASSSDWFLPSTKELSLLINCEINGTEFDDILYFNNAASHLRLKNKPLIDYRLSMLSGAEPLGRVDWAYDYWSSTEWTYSNAYQISPGDGSIMGSNKANNNNQLVRCVLAF